MYFKKTNNFFHGIMFHHFHDNQQHIKSQGSISQDDLDKIIKYIGRNNILNADEFIEKLKKNKLKNNEVCFTFDDAIKCQIDIALPVLEDYKIKSFFFIYTSILEGQPDNLEIFRFFRINKFEKIDNFYNKFYKFLNLETHNFLSSQKEKLKIFKQKFPFYSTEDIKFRIIRDYFLKKNKYEETMFEMMNHYNFKYEDYYKKLFFEANDISNLNNLGHEIGLHSHSHPTLLEKLSYKKQKKEYEKCLFHLNKILKNRKNEIISMSHPCGSYDYRTLEILSNLNIEIGFKQIMGIEKDKGMKKVNNTYLEIARQDHSSILKELK